MNRFAYISPRKRSIAFGFALTTLIMLVAVGLAQGFTFPHAVQGNSVPPVFSYQGVLSDPSSGNLLNGTYDMTFKIYSSPSGPNLLWQETQQVTSTGGLFNVYLGSVNPLDPSQFTNQELYLGVTVGSDSEMTPRLRLASAPFAFTSEQTYCAMATFYQDQDGDTYGNPAVRLVACTMPSGFSANNLDCNDLNAGLNPGAAEICNNTDENCNSIVDDGDPGGGGACATGLAGVCAAGTSHCNNGSLQCFQNVEASSETCDGLDNDCNGMVDEGDPGGGEVCSSGSVGVCSTGTWHCVSGALQCSQNIEPSPETCDNLDNDCDNLADEGDPGGGDACATGLPGVCSAGTSHCANGMLLCFQNIQPSTEICDGLDNDCDGVADEGCP